MGVLVLASQLRSVRLLTWQRNVRRRLGIASSCSLTGTKP